MSVIKDISKKLGLSESTVKKIISDPFAFSDKTSNEVLKLYNQSKTKIVSNCPVVGVLIPKRPMFFWKDVTAGMNDCIKSSGKNVKLSFLYYTRDYSIPASDWDTQSLDGFICYPYDKRHSELESKMAQKPCIIFNEEDAILNEEGNPKGVFIGPDGYDEGVKAASLLKGQSVEHVAIVRINGKVTVDKRIRGFKDQLKSMMPNVKTTVIMLKNLSEISSAILAKKLADAGFPDCVYVTTGATYVGGGAIAKLRDKTDKRMVLVGHELCQADKKYLADGTMLGYVIQDAYMQGYCAAELMFKMLEQKSIESVYVESKVVLAER